MLDDNRLVFFEISFALERLRFKPRATGLNLTALPLSYLSLTDGVKCFFWLFTGVKDSDDSPSDEAANNSPLSESEQVGLKQVCQFLSFFKSGSKKLDNLKKGFVS